MKPEAQRIAIAEACGAKWGHPVFNHDCKWHVHFAKEPFEFDSSWAGKPPPFDECVKELDVPDYLNDLNAMHEAEKVLGREQIHKFLDELEHIVIRDQAFLPTVSWLNWLCIHATAAQHAEAFLRALNLWVEDDNADILCSRSVEQEVLDILDKDETEPTEDKKGQIK